MNAATGSPSGAGERAMIFLMVVWVNGFHLFASTVPRFCLPATPLLDTSLFSFFLDPDRVVVDEMFSVVQGSENSSTCWPHHAHRSIRIRCVQ